MRLLVRCEQRRQATITGHHTSPVAASVRPEFNRVGLMLQLTTFQSLIRLSAVTEMKQEGSGDENLHSVAILGDMMNE